ncbi:MAG: ComF family protein [Bacillota bacterium]
MIRVAWEDKPLRKALITVTGSLVELFFPLPEGCAFCGKELPGWQHLRVCRECLQAIGDGYRWICFMCGRPLIGTAALEEGVSICTDCHSGARAFDLARAAGRYSTPLSDTIHYFKSRPELCLAGTLGTLMGFRLEELACLSGGFPDLVVPVPMDLTRLRGQGFNHSRCLAQVLARQFELPLREVLQKREQTPPPKGATRSERFARLKDAFRVRHRSIVRNKHVLLVDDVMITGSTAEACATVLKQEGARRVDVLVAASVPAIPARQTLNWV